MADENSLIPQGAQFVAIQPTAPPVASTGDKIPDGAQFVPIQPQKFDQSPEAVAARHARAREGKDFGPDRPAPGVAEGLATGVGKGSTETVQGLVGIAQKAGIPVPSAITNPQGSGLVDALDTTAHGAAESIGKGAETVGEFAVGDELLSGLGKLSKVASKYPQLIELMEKFPKATKMILGAAKGAVVGGVQSTVKESREGGKGAIEGATEGAAGGAVGGAVGAAAGEAISAGTEKLGALLEKHAPDFMNSLLRASQKANYLYGKNPGRAIIDEGISAPTNMTLVGQLEDIHGQLEGAVDSLDSQLKQILSDPAVAAQKTDVVPLIRQTIADAKNKVVGERGLPVKMYLRELTNLENDLLTKYDVTGKSLGKVTREELNPAEISDMKKSIGKNTQWKLFPTDPQYQLKGYLNSVRKAIYGQLADVVESAAPDANVKILNARMANAIEAQGLLEKRIAQEHGTGGWGAGIRKAEWGTALGSIFTGHPYLGAAFLANRLARSAPGRVLESRGAAAAGKALQSAPAKAVAGAVKAALPTVGGAAGAAAASSSPDQWIHVIASDGKHYEIHPEDVDKAKQQDPNLQIVNPQQ